MIWETEKGALIAEQTLRQELERGCVEKEKCSAFEVRDMERCYHRKCIPG